jgi:hypothetical protein
MAHKDRKVAYFQIHRRPLHLGVVLHQQINLPAIQIVTPA